MPVALRARSPQLRADLPGTPDGNVGSCGRQPDTPSWTAREPAEASSSEDGPWCFCRVRPRFVDGWRAVGEPCGGSALPTANQMLVDYERPVAGDVDAGQGLLFVGEVNLDAR